MHIPEERQFSLDHAELRIKQEIDDLGIVAETDLSGDGPCLAHTRLHDAHGRLLTVGWGKGEAQAATVGSLHEAMEHLLSQRHVLDGARLLPVESVMQALQDATPADMPMSLMADQIEETIACRHYTSLCGQTGFNYPVVLSAPDYLHTPLAGESFDHAGLRRYASNSGTAIGASPAEALLHALNECLERDALSMFLLTHFFHDNDAPLRVIVPTRMPQHMAALHQRASAAVGAPITLLDISDDQPVTTCLAIAHRRYAYPRPFGAGASLNPAHAARRALTELVQADRAAEQADSAVQQNAAALFDDLRPWPRLLASLTMDIEARLRNQPTIESGLRESPGGDIRAQVRRIAAALHTRGLHVGYTLLQKTRRGTTLANVVVPGMERFYMVTTGNVVLPGSRGQARRTLQ